MLMQGLKSPTGDINGFVETSMETARIHHPCIMDMPLEGLSIIAQSEVRAV